MTHLYASFDDAVNAQKAAGALFDHGVGHDALSLIVAHEDAPDTEDSAKNGLSTTTVSDAAAGANKGAGLGLGIGAVAALVSLFVPGFGWVLGGGALATAIAGAVGATAAGAVVGGVGGYLEDQGMPRHAAETYEQTMRDGGAVISVTVGTGDVTLSEIESVLIKYEASEITTYDRYAVAV